MRLLRITGAAAIAVLAALPLVTSPAQAAGRPIRAAVQPYRADADTATLTGVITNPDGTPSEATISVSAVDGSYDTTGYTDSDGDGRYRIEGLPPGQYRVGLYDNFRGGQYIPGKESIDDAEVFTLTAGSVVEADDQWLPLGTVRVTVGDAVTGKPVPTPCAYVEASPNGVSACGKNGVVVVANVPPGYWKVDVSGGASYFTPETDLYTTVKRSKTTKLITTLQPGAAVKTKVVDSATGLPLTDICVRVVDAAWSGISASPGLTCADDKGNIEIGPYTDAETDNLFAFQYSNPYDDPPAVHYGSQWVGAKGGTGDQRKALKVDFVPQTTKTVATIRMDAAGSITGVIRDAGTGQPVRGVCAEPYAFLPWQGTPSGSNCANADGQYTIEDLGPYAWPVEFTPVANQGYAWQWSGDAADRFAATYSTVPAGGTVSVDAALVKGGSVAGTVTTGSTPVQFALVDAYNSKTHDFAGPTWDYTDSAGAFSLPGFRTQKVLLNYQVDGSDCWYSTGGAATPVKVTDGATTTLAIDSTGSCGSAPVPAATRQKLH